MAVVACPDGRGASQRDTTTSNEEITWGEIFGNLFGSRKAITEKDPDAIAHLRDSSDPYIILSNRILREIARDFSGFPVVSTVVLAEKPTNINRADRDRFKSAVNFAKHNRADRACEIWQSLKSTNRDSVPLLINLGICQEVQGNLIEAREYFRQADRLTDKPDKLINLSLERINEKIKRAER
jgi:tetratricopeptide (TPR) repeat protein